MEYDLTRGRRGNHLSHAWARQVNSPRRRAHSGPQTQRVRDFKRSRFTFITSCGSWQNLSAPAVNLPSRFLPALTTGGKTATVGGTERRDDFTATPILRPAGAARAHRMKKILSNLLIIFALALCGLCTFQWVREAALRKDLDKAHQTVFEREQTVQGLQSSAKKAEAELVRLDQRNLELREYERTNKLEVVNLGRSLRKVEGELETAKLQLDAYKKAVDQQNENLKKMNAVITEQNETLKRVVGERDELVKKFNDAVKQHNDVVTKYNDLVKQVEKAQADAAAKSK